MIAVAWRRGFFRLWVAVSVFWFIGTAIIAFNDTGIPSLTKDCSVLLEFKADSTGQMLGPADVSKCEDVWRNERLKLIATGLGPPVTLLIVGLILGWIMRGFRRPSL
jgi:hypothetical protein